MTLRHPHRSVSGFNVIDLLVLIGVVGLLIAVAVPMLLEVRAKTRQVDCLDNLRTVRAGMDYWSSPVWDYPMALSTNEKGTLEVAHDVWRTFQVVSNELKIPRVLMCPADSRTPAVSWSSLANSNISYFLGLDATVATPKMMLAGERHLGTGKRLYNRVLKVNPGDVLRWTTTPHPAGGNVVFGDGSATSLDERKLQAALDPIRENYTNELRRGQLRFALP